MLLVLVLAAHWPPSPAPVAQWGHFYENCFVFSRLHLLPSPAMNLRLVLNKISKENQSTMCEIVENKMESKPLQFGCEDHWTWNKKDKSHEVRLYGTRHQVAHFHPNWSNGTAGVRGTRILNHGCFYWEIQISKRMFGTSMMFGIGTKKARLHVDAFVNLLGFDQDSWGLSHKGLLWHNGKCRQYTRPFRENEATTIGLYFDGSQGTLSYYKDGVSLGVAFSELDQIQEPLYPIVCSTAAKTEMTLGLMKRSFVSLQDHCRATILRHVSSRDDIEFLNLPNRIKCYLMEGFFEPRIHENNTHRHANSRAVGSACQYV